MKIAIVGTGISGLAAAYLLHKDYEITIFEQNDYIGGHTRTINIDINNNETPVDTGFIVFNKINYPNLSKLFVDLDIPIHKSKMSFGVKVSDINLEYGTNSLLSIFAQRKNIINYKYWAMIFDIIKFNSKAKLHAKNDMTISDLIQKMKLGDYFKNYYLLPMCGAIWSSSIKDILKFPAKSIIKFFDNHGLLTISNQPQWYTVDGGSIKYIDKLINGFKDKIKIKHKIISLKNKNNIIELQDNHENKYHFDEVILAGHSDQASELLKNSTSYSRDVELLKNISYQKNTVIVHGDDGFMPKNKKAWSSWVYASETTCNNNSTISVTYWMNNLQKLNTGKNIFVTLNSRTRPNPEQIYDEYDFYHPTFDHKAIMSQNKIEAIQGVNRVWYCGAWLGYGFHEDGLHSAIKTVKKIKEKNSWNENV